MRKILAALFISTLLMVGSEAQQSTQLIFDEANTLLEQSDYSGAMDIYRTIANGEEASGALFLNMGIAATQLDSMGLAKYYFLMAHSFPTTEANAEEALQYVESQFSRQSATLPKLPWDKAVDWLKMKPTSLGVFYIGFSFICIGVIFILLAWFDIFRSKQTSKLISFSLLSGLLILLLSFYVDYVDQRYSEGIIVRNEIQVKQKPSDDSDLVSLAYEGYSITIDFNKSEVENDWLYIRLGNGQFGWIENRGIKIL